MKRLISLLITCLVLPVAGWAAGLPMTATSDQAEAVRDNKLVIPISRKLPLSNAAQAQAAAEEGSIGKVLLVA